MPKLALNDHKRDASVRHLDGMGVSELVRRDFAALAALPTAFKDAPRPRSRSLS